MSAAPGERVEVGDLDPAGVLAEAERVEVESRRIEVRRLRLAYQWAVLHPATADTGVETPGGPGSGVLDADETLGGDGTPAVAAFAPESLAAAMGWTPAAARNLMADALDLPHRHPKLWKRVRRGQIPAWQARRVAQQTRRLPKAGARWVDDQLADRIGCGPVITDRLVAQAAAQFDPAEHQRREEQAAGSSDVELSHPQPGEYAGASDLTAHGDTLTLQAFYDLVCAIAHQLFEDGDTAPLGERKVKALGVIVALVTGGQGTLDFGAAAGKRSGKVKAYVHVEADDIDQDAVGTVEKLGAATLAKIKSWVGHHQVVIQPVLNMQRRGAVDHHDPPPWMRELVILRDGHCVFPGCTRDARACDLDHTEPYDPDGPPGQTNPDNLACLCRRHHRAKTLGLWRYTRTPDGDHMWHGPHGITVTVTSEDRGWNAPGASLARTSGHNASRHFTTSR